MSLKRRIEKLEQKSDTEMKYVWLHEGQTQEEARRQAGVPESISEDNVVFFSWLS